LAGAAQASRAGGGERLRDALGGWPQDRRRGEADGDIRLLPASEAVIGGVRMTRWLLVVLLIGVSVASADAQTKGLDAREHRVALVIGNAAYADAPLNNPGNDARGLAQALRAQGFEVIERVDADVTTMRRAVAQFGEKMREGGIGLFYYSGHGMQVNGRHFLVPVGPRIASEAYVSA